MLQALSMPTHWPPWKNHIKSNITEL